MANDEKTYFDMTLRRGEARPIVFVYRPRNKSLPPYNLTGKVVQMRIKPPGEAEIIYNAPIISITNGAGGEITISIPEATVNAYAFQNAPYAVLLDGKRLFPGTLTIKSLYE